MSHELAEAMHFCASAASGMLAKADKEMAGVSRHANLALYRDPVVASNIGASDFRISDLMNQDKAINLYLVISPLILTGCALFVFSPINCLVSLKMEFGQGGTRIASSTGCF